MSPRPLPTHEMDRNALEAMRRAKSGYDPAVAERARAAVAKFQRQLPALNAYARAITKDKDVRVVAHASVPCTDGKTIYMRPPIEMGDRVNHDRPVCGERDDRGVLLCPACDLSEQVMATIYHEIGHITANSFAELSDRDKCELLDRALSEFPSNRAEQIRARVDKINSQNYVDAAAAVSPFMPMLLNGLEDARVNRTMYEARPGIQAMFRGHIVKVFDDGIERADGSVGRWSEAPPNAQAVIGLFAKISGFDYESWFSPEVVAMLDDPAISPLIARFQTAQSMRAVYRMAFPFLEHLRAHGFCKRPDDVPDDEPEVPPMGDSSPGDDDDTEQDDTEQDESDQQEPAPDGDAPAPPSMPEDDPVDDDSKDDSGDADGEPGDDDEDADADADGSAGDGDTPEQDVPEDGADADADAGQDDADPDADAPEQDADGAAGGDDDDAGLMSDDDGDAAPATPTPVMGEPDEVQDLLDQFGGHSPGVGPITDATDDEDPDEQAELDRAVTQGDVFDAPSQKVFGVNEHRYDQHVYEGLNRSDRTKKLCGWGESDLPWWAKIDDKAPESLLAGTLARMRVVFSDNRKARKTRNMRSGRVNTRALRRFPLGDERLFYKKREPGKRDYFVLLGLDISSSMRNGNLRFVKEAALAQADLLSRLGVDFAIYAHNYTMKNFVDDNGHMVKTGVLDLDMYLIKEPNEPWSPRQRQRLQEIQCGGANLDGHALEYMRKVCDRQPQTDKIILYYTDGAMPAGNVTEEREILRRECKVAAQKGYVLMGVGIGTDSPKQYGLETCELWNVNDVPKVVTFLGKRIEEMERKKVR